MPSNNVFTKIFHIRASVVPVIFFALWLTGCAASTAPTVEPDASGIADSLTVIATYSILGDLVAEVAGDRNSQNIQLITLVGPNGDAHTFEPTPADSVSIANAAIIFENGIGFEQWLDDLYAASGSTADRIVVTEEESLLAVSEEEDSDHHEDEHGHGEFDPHVWHDVAHVMAMVEVIRDTLSEADAENAATYAANADEYLDELAKLDAWIVEQIATIPAERRKLVTAHDTFGYFDARYGVEVIGTAIGSSTEFGDPSAGKMAELVQLIRAEAVTALFTENVSNPELIERVAEETGVVIGGALITDALTEPGNLGDSYISMVRHNVEMMVEALGE